MNNYFVSLLTCLHRVYYRLKLRVRQCARHGSLYPTADNHRKRSAGAAVFLRFKGLRIYSRRMLFCRDTRRKSGRICTKCVRDLFVIGCTHLALIVVNRFGKFPKSIITKFFRYALGSKCCRPSFGVNALEW